MQVEEIRKTDANTDPKLFSEEFSSSNASGIANELKHGKGYYVFPHALAPALLEKLFAELPEMDCLVNNNHIGYVKAYSSNYLGHTLAVSKSCFDIVTSPQIRAICREYFAKPFKVCNQRIYQTHTASHLPWHTDNNLQSGNQYNGKHCIPGIMFMFYLSDVSDTNPFQVIPFSQKWPHNGDDQFFTDDYIDKNFSKDVVSVREPKGTLIMCSTRMVHRAEPFKKAGFKRFTFLFQVDEISDQHQGHGEKILVNTSFIRDRDPEILNYLGFGIHSDYPAFPETSASTMLPGDMVRLQKKILPKAAKGLMLFLAKKVLPAGMINNIRMKVNQKARS